jgi:hypothetical protein
MDWDPAYSANQANQFQKWWDSMNQVPSAYAYSSICERHLLRCYPKATDKFKFYKYIAGLLEQDEALVFWLCMISNDPREPFKNFAFNTMNNNIYYAGGNNITQLAFNDFPGNYPRNVHYEFDSTRLTDGDGDGIPGFEAIFCKNTTYMYFDSRTYAFSQTPAYSPRAVNIPTNGAAQPLTDGVAIAKGQAKFMNPNTFQILCSGQDGNYGVPVTAWVNGNFIWNNTKMFPGMANTSEEDSDNMMDFTEGKTLITHRP